MIREVTKDDAESLLSIYGYYVKETAVSFETEVPSRLEFQNRIETVSKRYPYLAAVDEKGEIVGYAYANSFKTRAAYDWSVEATVYLHKDAKRQGIGRALYEALEERLKKMGILNFFACIAMPKTENDPYLTFDSYRFHEKMGLKEVGRFVSCANKFGRWYDMVWMGKSLGEHPENPKKIEWK